MQCVLPQLDDGTTEFSHDSVKHTHHGKRTGRFGVRSKLLAFERVIVRNSALELLRDPRSHRGLLLTALFLKVHKIRVDSDNKRLARCTSTALTQSRKV